MKPEAPPTHTLCARGSVRRNPSEELYARRNGEPQECEQRGIDKERGNSEAHALPWATAGIRLKVNLPTQQPREPTEARNDGEALPRDEEEGREEGEILQVILVRALHAVKGKRFLHGNDRAARQLLCGGRCSQVCGLGEGVRLRVLQLPCHSVPADGG